MMTIGSWTGWKQLPNALRGGHIEAPIGPGVYEVRHASSGDLAAFDASANVAYALTSLLRKPPSRSWKKLFGGENPSWLGHELEYRTCATANVRDAKMMAQCLLGRRQVFWRRNAIAVRAGIPA
jgi:hypothetical protein